MTSKEMNHYLSVASRKEQVRILKQVIKLLGNVSVVGCYSCTDDVDYRRIELDKKTQAVRIITDICSG